MDPRVEVSWSGGIGVQKAMSFKQPESEDVASVRHR